MAAFAACLVDMATRWMMAFTCAGSLLLVAGCKRSEMPKTAPAEQVGAVASEGQVRVTVNQDGYAPSTIRAVAGRPLTLIFRRTSEVGCGDEVVFPKQAIKKSLPLNEDVAVTLTPEGSEIQFTCGMGMYKGAVVVTQS